MLPLMESASKLAGTVNPVQDGEYLHQAYHAHVTSNKSEMAQFYHQALFSPPAVTLFNAIKNKQLESFPGLVPSLIKHLPLSTATAKGHTKKNRACGPQEQTQQPARTQ